MRNTVHKITNKYVLLLDVQIGNSASFPSDINKTREMILM